MATQSTLVLPDRTRRHEAADLAGLFTIKEVSQASGLPGPVIMQLVPRTWVEPVGWLYTRDQISLAVSISEDLRRPAHVDRPEPPRQPAHTLSCRRCAALTAVGDAAVRGWLNVIKPDSGGPAAWDGEDYCAQCVMPCPNCRNDDQDRLCETCYGTRRVPRPPLAPICMPSMRPQRPKR